jgi:hypothetical protein
MVSSRGPDAGHPESVVSACQEPLADSAEAVQAEHAIPARVLVVLEIAELVEVTFEEGVQLVAARGM